MKVSVYYTKAGGEDSHALLIKSARLFSEEENLTLVSEYGKKPYFASGPVKFSLSHSGNIWVCAMAYDEVGLDFQLCSSRANLERVARHYFHPREYEAYLDGVSFYRIWTAKEAAVKLTGWGIDGRFARFDSTKIPIEAEEFPSAVNLKYIREIPSTERYFCSLASYEKAEVEIFEI